MARYRKLYIKIWQDKDFQNYKRDGKLVFVYLITNPYIGESGLYEITPKTISQDTDVDIKKVESLLSGGLKNVYYDAETSTVFVAKYRIYNQGGRPEFIVQAIENERGLTPSPLWRVFDSVYELIGKSFVFRDVLNGSERVPELLTTPTPTPTLTPTLTPTITPTPESKNFNYEDWRELLNKTDTHLKDKLLTVVETFNSTRKTGKVGDSVILKEVEYWLKEVDGERAYKNADLEAAADTWLSKRYHAEGKREQYFRGIIRGVKREREAREAALRQDTERPDGFRPANEV